MGDFLGRFFYDVSTSDSSLPTKAGNPVSPDGCMVPGTYSIDVRWILDRPPARATTTVDEEGFYTTLADPETKHRAP
jgi:hypothetical protein